MITPLWLSRSLKSFLYNSSMYSFYLFLISFASIRSLWFLSFLLPIFGWTVPLIILIFLMRSLVLPFLIFPPLFLFVVHWRRPSCLSLLFSGTLRLVGCTFPFLPCFSLLLSSAICKASSDNHFPFLHLFFFGMILFSSLCNIMDLCP